MTPNDLSDEQMLATQDHIRVIEAAPGSGKTRVLVARYLALADTPDSRGVALLSFTNAAVDEVRKRTGGSMRYVSAPHFVGTIDSFLHRFVVTPYEVNRLGRLPNYLASWDDLPSELTQVRLNGVRGSGISLSSFRLEMDGEAKLHEGALKYDERIYLASVDAAQRRQGLLRTANARIKGLYRNGTLDSALARLRAYEILFGPQGEKLVEKLILRFGAFLVDEAQDCDAAEMEILKRLAGHARVVLVADPDQAIYEFRGSRPELFASYRDSLDPSQVTSLATNYRSTAAIVAAIRCLRAAGLSRIVHHGPDLAAPVYVLSGDEEEQRSKFLELLRVNGLKAADSIVLAHDTSVARKLSGSADTGNASKAIASRLAIACWQLRCPGTSVAQRVDAIRTVERCCLSLLDWPEDLQASSVRDRLVAIERSSEWLRQLAGYLVRGLGGEADAKQFAERARTICNESLAGLSVPLRSLSQILKKPDGGVWAMTMDSGSINGLPYGSVHSSKGQEYPAVLLAIPNRLRAEKDEGTVLDDWEKGLNSERRRVLYVGASRAQELLAIGAGVHADRLMSLLNNDPETVCIV